MIRNEKSIKMKNYKMLKLVSININFMVNFWSFVRILSLTIIFPWRRISWNLKLFSRIHLKYLLFWSIARNFFLISRVSNYRQQYLPFIISQRRERKFFFSFQWQKVYSNPSYINCSVRQKSAYIRNYAKQTSHFNGKCVQSVE